MSYIISMYVGGQIKFLSPLSTYNGFFLTMKNRQKFGSRKVNEWKLSVWVTKRKSLHEWFKVIWGKTLKRYSKVIHGGSKRKWKNKRKKWLIRFWGFESSLTKKEKKNKDGKERKRRKKIMQVK